jgi:hypothetical protein
MSRKTFLVMTKGGRTYRRRKDGKFLFHRMHAVYLVTAPWSPASGGSLVPNRGQRPSPHPDRIHMEKP